MKVAYIPGTFDILHSGHLELFEKAKMIFDKVVVAVNTDEFTERFKRLPVNSLKERMRLVSAVKWVDEVIVNIGDESTGKTIDSYNYQHCREHISAIVHGNDWMGEKYLEQLGIDKEWLAKRKIVVCYFDRDERSTTSTIERAGKVGSSTFAPRLKEEVIYAPANERG